ncbi:MAG: L-serine ammonia-lyase, iron-sulfur-dependent, subunit alpha [Cyanobacteria bacterium RUI128]|nr:L-serine ammonia-lyase, iron-sulfur-dependent, subunit alpha [Cyanobacteria bacterium RUI128]
MSITTFKELKEACTKQNKTIWEITQSEEAVNGDTTVEKVREEVLKHIITMRETIKTGMDSNEKSVSNWCGDDCEKLVKRYSEHHALFGKLYEKILTYALATSEENLRMGRIVACPTAGSCGIIPGVLVAYSEENNLSDDEQINFLITAGKIGSIISNKVQLAGAVAGCQAECGVASAMCAGALAQTLGGDVDTILNAVALAIKNLLGLTCDPVCGLVEVPCIKRNPILSIHAVSAVELAMAGIESKIPVDEVIDAMRQTGQLMSPMLKESSLAGLATTKTALKLKEIIFNNQ